MLDQLKTVVLFYWNPRKAASETLDQGRLGIGILLAFLTALAIQAPSQMARQRLISEISVAQEVVSETTMSPEARKASATMIAERARQLHSRQSQAIAFPPEQALTELFVALAVFVPLGIAILAGWQGRGRVMMTVQNEFGTLLLCAAFSWTAARLPLAPLFLFAPDSSSPFLGWAWVASTAYFLFLCAACFRTALGVEWVPAGVTAGFGGFLFVAGRYLPINLSPMMFMMASPWLIYYFWGRISSGAASIGSSVSSRQSFRRAIEATTINPRDADAHYQLGLIQIQRRNWTEAESRFRSAAGIAPDDADYSFQLGRVIREQGRAKEAMEWLQRAAQLDDKTSSSEVWREIGAAQLALEDWPGSVKSLERYIARREYDPIGLVYLGEALSKSGRESEARQMFERAVEAVRTMPSYRRGELRAWQGRASQGLRRLS